MNLVFASKGWWRSALTALVLAISSAPALAQSSFVCSSAPIVQAGVPVIGTVLGAVLDGSSCTCQGSSAPAAYVRFTAAVGGIHTFSLCEGTAWDTVISIHSGCPASVSNELAGGCDDEGCRPAGVITFGFPSKVSVGLTAGTTYLIRVGAYQNGGLTGPFTLMITAPATPLGACCKASACSVQTQSLCAGAGGTYLGNATICSAAAGQPETYPALSPAFPAVITDNDPTGIVGSTTVRDQFTVGDVKLRLAINHTFLGDLKIELAKGGRTATILCKIGGGQFGVGSNLDGEYVFSDGASQSIWNAGVQAAQSGTGGVVLPGTYRASDERAARVSLRQTFAGLPAAGDWTLRVVDGGPGDEGTLLGWSVVLDRVVGPAGGEISSCQTLPVGLGACCYGTAPGLGGPCIVGDASICQAARGIFRGEGTLCTAGPNNPASCCPANFDLVAGLTPSDIFAFLNAYFSEKPGTGADFDADGTRSPQDIFAYLNAYFTGCR